MSQNAEKRKCNWTAEQTKALRVGYITNNTVIDGKLCTSLTNQDKDRVWKQVIDSVNAQGSCDRTVKEAKKKLSDLKTLIKRRERERRTQARQTGGGEMPVLEEWEERMLIVIGEEAIDGFGGFDVFRSAHSSATVTLPSTESDNGVSQQQRATVPDRANSPRQRPSCSNISRANSTIIPQRASCSISSQPQLNLPRTRPQNDEIPQAQELIQLMKGQQALLEEMLEQQKITNLMIMQLMQNNSTEQ